MTIDLWAFAGDSARIYPKSTMWSPFRLSDCARSAKSGEAGYSLTK